MRLYILLGVLFLAFAGTCFAVNCGGSACSASDNCCNDFTSGYACYDPSEYSCVLNQNNDTVLCPSGDMACGTQCYDPSDYVCDGQVLCPFGLLGCGSACYNPNSYTCCDSQLFQSGYAPSGCTSSGSGSGSSGSGSSGSGSGSGNGSGTYVTYVDPLFCGVYTILPCATGQYCCSGVCYDTTQQVCLENVLCPIGNELCSYDECYDPSAKECCNDVLYSKGTSPCSSTAATCCALTCDNTMYPASGSVTAAQPYMCNSAFLVNSGLVSLNCASFHSDACPYSCDSTDQSYDCPNDAPLVSSTCYAGPGDYACFGDGYTCGGGNYSTTVANSGACVVPAAAETGHNTTNVLLPGSTEYEPVPATYTGEVCCYCISSTPGDLISWVVPNVTSCNVGYIANRVSSDGSQAANLDCIVWSYAPTGTTGYSSYCGSPSA